VVDKAKDSGTLEACDLDAQLWFYCLYRVGLSARLIRHGQRFGRVWWRWMNRTITGLLQGAAAGLILLNNGNPIAAIGSLFSDHLFPVLGSLWNLSVLVFTLLLGGFVSVLEKDGGIQTLMRKGLISGCSVAAHYRRTLFHTSGIPCLAQPALY
jgi:hypothetical protein